MSWMSLSFIHWRLWWNSSSRYSRSLRSHRLGWQTEAGTQASLAANSGIARRETGNGSDKNKTHSVGGGIWNSRGRAWQSHHWSETEAWHTFLNPRYIKPQRNHLSQKQNQEAQRKAATYMVIHSRCQIWNRYASILFCYAILSKLTVSPIWNLLLVSLPYFNFVFHLPF